MFISVPVRIMVLALLLIFVGGCASHHGMEEHNMAQGEVMDHSAHQGMMEQRGYDRSVEQYKIPDLSLVDQDGQRVSLQKLLATDKPVIVNFLYATCTTICPLLSMGYIDLQRELGDKSDEVLMISFTIDPEHDSPEVLAEYRKKFKGTSSWVLLTGSRIDIDAAMTSFDSFFSDKMDHQPLNFIKLPEKDQWLRLNGMINGQDFLHELKMAGLRK